MVLNEQELNLMLQNFKKLVTFKGSKLTAIVKCEIIHRIQKKKKKLCSCRVNNLLKKTCNNKYLLATNLRTSIYMSCYKNKYKTKFIYSN